MMNAIVACDADFGIGINNELPWPKHTEDLKWFRMNTKNGIVIMGRKTWESLGNRPLKDRVNVVLTSRPLLINTDYDSKTTTVMPFNGTVGDCKKEMKKLYPKKTVWLIGGEHVFDQGLVYCDKLYLTIMKNRYKCDRFIDKRILDIFSDIEYNVEKDDCVIQIRAFKGRMRRSHVLK